MNAEENRDALIKEIKRIVKQYPLVKVQKQSLSWGPTLSFFVTSEDGTVKVSCDPSSVCSQEIRDTILPGLEQLKLVEEKVVPLLKDWNKLNPLVKIYHSYGR